MLENQDRVPDSLLRHRPFVFYWNARTCSAIAFQMMGVAVGWQMYEITNSPFDLGLVGLVQFLPALVLVLLAGGIADRYDRRLILQSCQVVESLAAAALAIASFSGAINKELLFVAVFFLGAGRSFEAPTTQTLLPSVVPSALFPRAVAASSSAQQAATILGPALGGFLYVASPGLVYGACALLLAGAALQLCFLRYERAPFARPPLTLRSFFAGVSYIRKNRVILGVISLDLFAVLLGGVTALLPVYAKDVLGAGSAGLGLLRAAPAAGAITVMVALTHAPLRKRIGRIEFGAVACYGVAAIAFALSQSFWLSMLALVCLGASDAVSVVIRMTLLQLETPDAMRGRVNAVNALFVTTSNQLGDFRAGTVASLLGAVPAVVLGGIGTLLVVLGAMKAFPELYAVERFRAEPVTP
jgi:MFS family permease